MLVPGLSRAYGCTPGRCGERAEAQLAEGDPYYGCKRYELRLDLARMLWTSGRGFVASDLHGIGFLHAAGVVTAAQPE